MSIILFNSIWVIADSHSTKKRRHKYQVINMDHGTIYFYSLNTGKHYQYSRDNFIQKYERVQ